MTNKPCIHELRGGEARCNGGAYDGCACGPYTVKDYRRMEEISWPRVVGGTKYRPAKPEDIVGAVVMNADTDALYLQLKTNRRTFVVHTNPLVDYMHQIEEYAKA